MKKPTKMDLVITSILARITDFQLQSTDNDFFEQIEDLREYIVKYRPKPKPKKNNQLELNITDA